MTITANSTGTAGLMENLKTVGIHPLVFVFIITFVAVELTCIVGFIVCLVKRCRSGAHTDNYHGLGADYFLIESPDEPERVQKDMKGKYTVTTHHANTEKPHTRTKSLKTHKRAISDPFEFSIPTGLPTIVSPQQQLSDQLLKTRKDESRSKLSNFRGTSLPEDAVPACADSADKGGAAREKRVMFAITKSQSTPANLFKISRSTDLGSIDPDLYRFDKSNFIKGLPSRHGLGKISFALTYDEELEQLHIFLDQAAQLPVKSPDDIRDTVVQILMTPNIDRPSATSRIVRRNTNPTFRQNFVFRVRPDLLKDTIIKFKVCEFDRFSHPIPIGHVMYPLDSHKKLDGGPPVWRDLQPSTPAITPEHRGELLVSLTFLPTAEKVNVIILKGRKLKMSHWHVGGTYKAVDTFVRITLVKAGKVLKNKHTGVCRKSCNPIFNEGFSLSVRQSDLDEVCVIFTVSVQLNHFGSSRNLGRFVVGKTAGAEGDSHWRDMISSPRTGVAQWHSLR